VQRAYSADVWHLLLPQLWAGCWYEVTLSSRPPLWNPAAQQLAILHSHKRTLPPLHTATLKFSPWSFSGGLMVSQ
jgi:hypothetical protein